MNLHRQTLDFLGESLYQAPLPGGLEALILPKRGVTGKTAILATRYGSLDVRYEFEGRIVETPPGVAHFLEHQLFKKEGGDALMEFSRYGASSNAYTDYTMTAYYFSCSDRFEDALGELVRLVFLPEFRREWVEREKSIIEQELRMYLDMPETKGWHNLLEALYRRHPVRIDIGGTIESTREVTPEQLELCYRAFYPPENTMLVIAGDLDPQHTFRTVRDLLRKAGVNGASGTRSRARTLFPEEPPGVANERVETRTVISRPRILIGFKDPVGAETPAETAWRDVLSSILLDLLFGRAGAFFEREYERGRIDDEFSAHYSVAPTFGFSTIGAETDDADGLVEAVRGEIDRARRRGFLRGALQRAQRRISGRFIRMFDSVEGAAFMVLETLQRRVPLEELIGMVFRVRSSDLRERLENQFRAENLAVSLVLPKDPAE